MEYIKKLFEHSKFKFILGFFLIILILFLRLRTRIDHNLKFDFTYYYFLLALCLAIFYGFLCYKLFSVTQRDNWLTQKKTTVITYIYESLDNVYQAIYPHIQKKVYLFVKVIVKKLLPSRIKYKKTIYFFGFIFPRILISCALFIDVVWFHYMHYLYKIIGVIWILMLFRITLYILKDWNNKLYNILTEHFDINFYVEQISPIEYKATSIKISQTVAQNKLLFTYKQYEEYISYYWLKIILLQDDIEKESKKPWVKYLNLIIYGTFFIVWCYTFYKIITNPLFVTEANKIITYILNLFKK